ncbi:MAG: flagellar biosynthetic protein FliR [Fervidobacterium sp.]|uniref:Flagellar biosynthetic protein FliR n=1 Tax=Fervidobacterium gondwanense DSM 13020 TaxID=1121883 RepID=A0A1M7SJI0_FERGO|nr:flagellar biosynthetic protein FliR [Fervidobacterium gondwanense]UXF01587.1 type III secretion protein [Fervidobacterium riparium]SHN58590.1 flagellar biosynthetic protein FliR [Fervidobacterium gondwanense DSM 13020]
MVNTWYVLLERYALSYALILSRLTGLMVIAPFFAGFSLPLEIMVILLIALGYLTLMNIPILTTINLPLPTIVGSVAYNFFIGFIIGLIAYTIVSSVYVGSEIFGIQSGFNVSGSLDPTVEESPITSEFIYLISIYIFVSLKGHLVLYEALVNSFQKFPILITDIPFKEINNLYYKVFIDTFLFSLQIALPLIGLMFLINVLFGILSRLVPQMNVFMVAMPASTMIMFLLMVVMIPVWVELISKMVYKMEPYIAQLLSR